ncbi:anti-sigma factor antagonist [Acidaminobacterium chupaoyuni]
MKITQQEGSQLHITLQGDLGHHEALTALQKIGEEIEAVLPRAVLLDFSQVTFMDSSGIAVVIQSMKKAKEYGGTLTVQGVSKQAMKVFQAAGIPKIVTFR